MTTTRSSKPDDSLNRISGTIAHELDGALTVIFGSLHDLAEKMDAWANAPPQVRRSLDYAKRGADRIAALAMQLRAAAGQKRTAAKPIDLNNVLFSLSEKCRKELRAGIALQLTAEPNLWTLEVEPAQLEIAIGSLVSNAQDAMPAGGMIEVTATNKVVDTGSAVTLGITPGEYVRLSLRDNGIGMTAEMVQRAPEMFFTTKARAGRLGLGLTQVFAFAAFSQGDVTIESHEGKGTCVTIYLPRMGTNKAKAEITPQPRDEGRRSILLVDDDDDLRGYIAETLEDLNYSVATAGDGGRALRQIEDGSPQFDLLLTDMMLPGMSGRELAKHVLRLRPHMRILFMSGHSPNDHVDVGKAGSFEIIAKPMTKADLKERIAKVLDIPAPAQQCLP